MGVAVQSFFDPNPTFETVHITALTASRLLASDADKQLVSTDISGWISGTANQINTADDGDGTMTLSTPQNVDTACDFLSDTLAVRGATSYPAGSILLSTNGLYGQLAYKIHSTSTLTLDGDNVINYDTPSNFFRYNSSNYLNLGIGATGIAAFAPTGAAAQIYLNGPTRIQSLSGLLKGTTGVVSAITDNSANWDLAVSHISADGSSHTFIDQAVTVAGSPTFAGLTLTGAQTITVTDAEALKVEDASNNALLIVDASSNMCVTVGGAAGNPYYGMIVQKYGSDILTTGLYGGAINTRATGGKPAITGIWALYYGSIFAPSGVLGSNQIITNMTCVKSYALVDSYDGETNDITVTEIIGLNSLTTLRTGTNSTGAITATAVNIFKAENPVIVTGSGGATPTITTLCGFYDEGMTMGGANWGYYGLSSQNYMAGTLDAAGYKVAGAAGFTGTGAYTNFTIAGGIIIAAS